MRSSVVENLMNRQITVCMPPMEVHLHSDVNLIMLWNKKQNNTDGCFKNCILSYTIDKETLYHLKNSSYSVSARLNTVITVTFV
jgi:hypothetical protein